jgi:hypothetical protein
MTEEQYYQVANACDALLCRADVPLEWIAMPWLHVVNEHPIHLDPYEQLVEELSFPGKRGDIHTQLRRWRSLVRQLAGLARNVFRSGVLPSWRKTARLSYGPDSPQPYQVSPADVIIVSGLVNVDHLKMSDDFYFGKLQALLAERGVSSLLVLRNQTDEPTSALFEQAWRGGPCARLLLPELPPLGQELGFIRRCLEARQRFLQIEREATSTMERRITREARRLIVSNSVIGNLILHHQIAHLCCQTQPSVLMALYEGYAWERCVWHAARTIAPNTLCVGYQHTVLRRRSFSVKRLIGSETPCDPDLILTVGDVTRESLAASQELQQIRLRTFGTHRRAEEYPLNDGADGVPTFLVLPEGIELECSYLFEFALDCARRLPDTRFIFRTHPILPFEKIQSELRGANPLPDNVEVSRGQTLEADFTRSSHVLYRGSSTVIGAILAGLKPYYLARANEADIDPLFALSEWREHVESVEELVSRHQHHQEHAQASSTKEEWQRARKFCERYIQPTDEEAIDEMLQIAHTMR